MAFPSIPDNFLESGIPKGIDQSEDSSKSRLFHDIQKQRCSLEMDLSTFRLKLEDELMNSMERISKMSFDFCDLSEVPEDEVNQEETNPEHCVARGDVQKACTDRTETSLQANSIEEDPQGIDESTTIADECGDLKDHVKCLIRSENLDEESASNVTNSLRHVIKMFINCANAARDFTALFPSWMNKRSTSISNLKQLAESLNRLHSAAHSTLDSHECCYPSNIFVQSASQSAKVYDNKIAEKLLDSTTKLAKASLVCLKEDKELFKVFQEWFDQSALLVKSLNKFLDLNTFVNLLDSIKKLEIFLSGSTVDDGEFRDAFSDAFFPVFLDFRLSGKPTDDLDMIVAMLYFNRRILKLFLNLHNTYPLFSGAIMVTAKTALERAKIMHVSADDVIAMFVSLVDRPGSSVFRGAQVAFDVLLTIASSLHSHDCSQVQHSEAIQPILKILGDELDSLLRLYKVIRKCVFQIS